jgi:teichuronic acid biosynthesis glycosyltransferase TuaC
MLRVLVLSTLFPDAARPNFGVFVERQTLGLAARADIQVQIVVPRGLPPAPLSALPRYRSLAALPSFESWKGLPLHRPRFLNLPGVGGRLHPAALSAALVPLLTRIRRDFPFDIIAAEYFFPDGVAAVGLARRFGVPVSIRARGSDIHHWGSKPATAQAVRRAGCRADGMIAVSEAMRQDMIALGLPGDRISCIANGVDLARFAPRDRREARAQFGTGGPLILSAGALIPLKGHAIVIDAVAALPDVQLWIVGEGPERERLARRITEQGLQDRVRLLGSVAHDRMPALFAAADAMALASEREGLANVWLEALASGTPIVVPDIGGARQVVRSPDAGRIVARDAASFAQGIAAILTSPPLPQHVRATVEGFTWEANAERLHGFLAGLVARRGAG